MSKLYYTPPTDEAFEDMRKSCVELWEGYDDPRYVAEKTERIKVIHNVGDNFMYMFAMLDHLNQRKVADKLAPSTKKAVRERMKDGGNPTELIDDILGTEMHTCAICKSEYHPKFPHATCYEEK